MSTHRKNSSNLIDFSEKELRTYRNKLQAELEVEQTKQEDIRGKIKILRTRIQEIDDRLNAPRLELTLTEHAILRYLERKQMLNVNAITEEILTPTLKNQVDTLGDGKYPISNGLFAVVKNKRILSIVES